MKVTTPRFGAFSNNLPERPAPEIDVEVVKVLDMNSRRVAEEVAEDRFLTFVPAPHPAAQPLDPLFSGLDHLPEVRGIPDADENGHVGLDVPRTLVLLGQLLLEERRMLALVRSQWRLEGVGEVDVSSVAGERSARVEDSLRQS
jgi:hypothetical protein